MRPKITRLSLLLIIAIAILVPARIFVTAQEATSPEGTPAAGSPEASPWNLEINCGTTKILPDHSLETPVPTVMSVDYACTTYDTISTNLSVSAIYTIGANQSLAFEQATPVSGFAGNMVIFVLDGSLNVTIVDLCAGRKCAPESATANQPCVPAASAYDSCAEYGVIDPTTHTIQWTPFELGQQKEITAGQMIRTRFVIASLQAGESGAIIGTSGGNIIDGGGCVRSCVQPGP